MNKKVKSILQMLLPIMLLLSFASVFTTGASPEKPKVRVVPKDNVFSTDPASPDYKAVGDTFTVNVTAVDWPEPGLFALSFKLYYDNTILEALSISPNDTFPLLPSDHFMVPGTHWPPGTWKKGGLYIVSEGTGIWHAEGYAGLALTLTGDEPGHVGTGTIAQVTFKITRAPPTATPLSCALELKREEVILSDPKPAKIPPDTYDVENGYYEYGPPKPPVFLKVVPEIVGAIKVGDQVVVNVKINEVKEEIKFIGVQWKLHFNSTLLSVTNVTEGDFFRDWAETAGLDPNDIFFWWLQEGDYVISFTIYAKFVVAPPTVFPEGSGTLATIKFNAIYKPETGRATCDLVLDKEFVKLLDVDGNVIPYHHLVNGRYIIPMKIGDLNFDDKVDILDLAEAGKAYGSYPGHRRWNSLADVVRDEVINILDIVTVARNFGK